MFSGGIEVEYLVKNELIYSNTSLNSLLERVYIWVYIWRGFIVGREGLFGRGVCIYHKI